MGRASGSIPYLRCPCHIVDSLEARSLQFYSRGWQKVVQLLGGGRTFIQEFQFFGWLLCGEQDTERPAIGSPAQGTCRALHQRLLCTCDIGHALFLAGHTLSEQAPKRTSKHGSMTSSAVVPPTTHTAPCSRIACTGRACIELHTSDCCGEWVSSILQSGIRFGL